MSKLEKLAKRISEISNEIHELKTQREFNLSNCQNETDGEFEPYNTCLSRAYESVKEDRELANENNEFGYNNYIDFSDVLEEEGCINCIASHKQKREIGQLKQERGRIVGNISKIGKTL